MSHVVVLQAGAATLRLAPALGGRITACALEAPGGSPVPVLHPYPEHHTDLDRWAKGGLYPLVPYSGRIRNAQLHHAGRPWPLWPQVGSPHALHGHTHRRPWTLVNQGVDHAHLQHKHTPDTHWPWAFDATLQVHLAPQQATVAVALRNTGHTPMPAGIGLHPYLVHQPDDHVCFDALPPWPFDVDYLALPPGPPGTTPARHTLGPSDFAASEVTRFHASWAGHLDVLAGQCGRPRLQLVTTGALNHLVVHRPALAPYVCVEPVSHVADGFNLHAQGVPGTGTRVLEPGGVVAGELRLCLG